MKSSEYSDLKTCLAVAQHGSFANAARHLKMTPSAVSQIIRRLEQQLDIRLFNRTTRSISLTTEGQALITKVGPALSEIEATFSELKSQKKDPAGKVNIHTTSSAANLLLETIIGQFHQTFPSIVLDIVVEDKIIDIVDNGFDLGISLGEYVQKDMIAYPLMPETQLVAAASPNYIDQYGIPSHPNELRHHRCLNWRFLSDNSVYRWEFFIDGHWQSYRVDGPLTSTSRSLLLSSALKGSGIILWEENVLQPWFDNGQLIPLLREYCHPFLSWHMFYPQQKHMPKAVRLFIDFMREHYPASRLR